MPRDSSRGTQFIPFQVKSQSIIKLYIFYNMLEVGDKLMSSFGQDSLDALHWTATEPRRRKRQHLGTLPHFFLATVYVCILARGRRVARAAGRGLDGILEKSLGNRDEGCCTYVPLCVCLYALTRYVSNCFKTSLQR